MRALVYRGPGEIRLEQVPEPVLQGPGDAVVRVTATSICGTDVHILRGHMPGMLPGTIVGHEFVGLVEEVGSAVAGLRAGDRVAGPAAVWCGRCRTCRRGLPALCENRGIFGCGSLYGDLPGAQAEFVRVPFADGTLKLIPPGLTDEQAIFAGDILATGYSAVVGMTPGERGVIAGDTVAVFGAGPVGLCAVACAMLFGPAHVVAVDLEDYRLELAARFGADLVVNPTREDPKTAIRDLTDGWGADLVVEAVGRPETLGTAMAAVAPGGTVSVVGLFQEAVPVPVPRMTQRNVTLRMGLGDLSYMALLLGLIEAGRRDQGAAVYVSNARGAAAPSVGGRK
jgi:threonine dehydrogenase-like Zn-dependent dehydrogenase